MDTVKWFNFSRTGNTADSLERGDAGTFCELNGVLFVVPLFEAVVVQPHPSHLQQLISETLSQARPGEIFEFFEHGFSKQITVNWPDVIRRSIITLTRS